MKSENVATHNLLPYRPPQAGVWSTPSGTNQRESRAGSYSVHTVAQVDIATDKPDVIVQFVQRQLKASENWKERRKVKEAAVARLQQLGFLKAARELEQCHSTVNFTGCEQKHVFNVMFDEHCGLPFCPDCQHEKAMREFSRNLPKIQQALRENPKLIPALLTPTIKSDRERSYNDGNKEMKEVFKKLRRRPFFKKNVAGGTGRIENTFSTESRFHPHGHYFLLMNDYIEQEVLSDALSDITGGESMVIDIRQVNNVLHGLLEVLKYPFKCADILEMDAEDVRQILRSKGTRLGISFGVLYGTQVEEEELSELRAFLDEAKDLKPGADCCPVCRSSVRRFSGFTRKAFEQWSSAAIIPEATTSSSLKRAGPTPIHHGH